MKETTGGQSPFDQMSRPFICNDDNYEPLHRNPLVDLTPNPSRVGEGSLLTSNTETSIM